MKFLFTPLYGLNRQEIWVESTVTRTAIMNAAGSNYNTTGLLTAGVSAVMSIASAAMSAVTLSALGILMSAASLMSILTSTTERNMANGMFNLVKNDTSKTFVRVLTRYTSVTKGSQGYFWQVTNDYLLS